MTPEAALDPEPEVYHALLDGPLFEALFDDLAQCAEISSVHVKRGVEARADEAPITLEKARMLLVLGQVHAVRVRYRHEGLEWIDTILRGGPAMRLVRTRVPGLRVAQPVARPKRRLAVLR